MTIDEILHPLPRVETALHGPAHPEEFRVNVGRWGERFYFDPLPACQLAPACDDTWPSVSTIKKAADRDWSWTSLERAAGYLEKRRGELDGLNTAEIHARLLEINKAGLSRAAGRGTSIHAVMEALAAGGTPPTVTAEAEPYLPACRQFLDQHQPEWVLSEVVAINRQLGYGGTFDAVLRIGGRTLLIDWKTRKAGKHGAYPEEAWQLAAYANADYIIIGNGEAKRAPMPHLDGALIISIAPEGARPYPVDLAAAWDTFQSLHTFWAAKQHTVVLKPIKLANGHHKPPPPDRDHSHSEHDDADPQPIGPTAELVAYRAWILGRLNALKGTPAAVRAMAILWPAGVPGVRSEHPHTEAELELIADALDAVETEHSMPFPAPDPRQPPPAPPADDPEPVAKQIDEGPDCTGKEMLATLKQVDALPPAVRMTLLNEWAKEALDAGAGFNIRHRPSQRRLAIYKACLNLAVVEDADAIRACIHHTLDDTPVATVGAVLGSLTIDQATRLAETAAALTNGGLTLHYRDNGSAYLTPNSESDQQ